MTLTVFVAICILGCDLLIYFLFQWAVGEKRRGKRRRARQMAPGRESDLVVVHGAGQSAQQPRKVVPYRNSARLYGLGSEGACGRPEPVTEEMVYRRRMAAFAGLK
jgi:hypothetical protein